MKVEGSETKVAVTEDGRLVELYVEREKDRRVGRQYLQRNRKKYPARDAGCLCRYRIGEKCFSLRS